MSDSVLGSQKAPRTIRDGQFWLKNGHILGPAPGGQKSRKKDLGHKRAPGQYEAANFGLKVVTFW